MQSIRLAASAATTLLLLALAALLWVPSFEMPTMSATVGIGRGALPQFCVVAAAVLATLVFVRDLLAWRRAGAILGPFDISPGTDPRRVVGVGFAALLMLSAYVVGWQFVGFLPTSIAFIGVTALVLLPRAHRTPRALAAVAATALVFGVGVWALFVYVLQVPLR